MSRLSSKAENALNETRMLILGAQVLVGFAFQAALQPGFARLPFNAQVLMVLGLGLMLVAAGVLIAPGAFHQIVESGYDTPRLLACTAIFASVALLPFALGLGIEAYVAGIVVLGQAVGIVLGVFGTLFALTLWYGLPWAWQLHDRGAGLEPKESSMEPVKPTSIESRVKQVLVEARVVLPGAQALLGFQLAAMLTVAFDELPRSSQYVHLVSLVLLALTIVLLMGLPPFTASSNTARTRSDCTCFRRRWCSRRWCRSGWAWPATSTSCSRRSSSHRISRSRSPLSAWCSFTACGSLTLAIRLRDQRRHTAPRASRRQLRRPRAPAAALERHGEARVSRAVR
jgi:hypothetical protein